MSPVQFKKMPCRPVEFKGQGPQLRLPFLPLTVFADATGNRWEAARACVVGCGEQVPATLESFKYSSDDGSACRLVGQLSDLWVLAYRALGGACKQAYILARLQENES